MGIGCFLRNNVCCENEENNEKNKSAKRAAQNENIREIFGEMPLFGNLTICAKLKIENLKFENHSRSYQIK